MTDTASRPAADAATVDAAAGPSGGDLPPLRYGERLARAGAGLEGLGCDALLVSKLAHIRYLTGFTGSNALLLLGPDTPLFVTDGRYGIQAAAQLAGAGVTVDLRVETVKVRELVVEACADRPRIGLEAAVVTWAQQRRYAGEWFPDQELVPTEGFIEGFRAVKEPGEVARIEAAADIADAALRECVPMLAEGPTEAAFALALEVAMRGRGADGPAFETIIASGPNSALPHARPGARRIGRGDLVVIDFGAMVEGYRSDMTRTVCVGPPSADQRRLYEVVADAQATARDQVRAGIDTKDIDATARQVIDAAGWGEQFSHGTGHGIGLEVHEAPAVSRTATDQLREGVVVTVEPGVYLEGVGGVRVEDTVVVTADGCRSLTKFPKSLTW
jgi:Xaa-Pro aminopeptidase